MSQINFSCSNCQQAITAPPEYAGMQINCPTCQALLDVPKPEGPAKKGKLTKAPSTVEHTVTTTTMAAANVRKAKKPRIGLYVGLGVGAAVAIAVILLLPKLSEKYQEHKDAVVKQAEATNAPQPPPPDLSADEVLRKVSAAYKAYTSYNTHGESVSDMDMSAMNPALKTPTHATTKVSILLGRPSLYRLEWEKESQTGTKTVKSKGDAWSAGSGDFVQVSTAPTRVKNREIAITSASSYSGTLESVIPALFFEEANDLSTSIKDLGKTNNETLDSHKCYVLTGKLGSQKMELWVHKDDFVIARIVVHVGGKLDDAILAALPTAQRLQMEKLSKIKGSIVETYTELETNQPPSPDAFQKAIVEPAATMRKFPKPGGAGMDRRRGQ